MKPVAVVILSALVGALVGAAVTVLLAPRFIKVTPSGNTVVAPLGPINNNLTEESAVINVASQAGSAVVEIKTTVSSPDQFVQQEQHGIGSGFIVRSDGYIVTNNHVVENAKLVVPVETAGLLGAAQALRSVLDSVPSAGKS